MVEELMNNTQEQEQKAAEAIIEKAPTFFEKHSKTVAEVGVAALIGGIGALGIRAGVERIKKMIEDRKKAKAAAVAEVTEELPEETQE